MFKSNPIRTWVVVSFILKCCMVIGVILAIGAFPAVSFAKTAARPSSQSKIVAVGRVVLLSHGTASYHLGNTSPNIVQDQCLATDTTDYSTSPNDVHTFAEVENNCLATTTGTMSMYLANNCGGVSAGNGYTSWNFRLIVNYVLDEDPQWGVGCVICDNGVPIDYPNFTVDATVTASGNFTYHNILYQATSNKAGSGLIDVQNDGTYAPPCP